MLKWNVFTQIITAWQFLTIIPVKKNVETTAESLAQSMAFFPMIGLFLGLILYILDALYQQIFPHHLASAILLASYIGMYGGFHLDGFADTIDGLAGGSTRDDILRIMKDSATGAIGVVAISMLLLLKYHAINEMIGAERCGTIILMPIVGRWAEVLMVWRSAYARREGGLGRPFTEHVKIREILIAGVFTAALSWMTLGYKGLILCAFISLLSWGMKRFAHNKIGGITGDVLGAGGELSELSLLLMVIAFQYYF